MVISLGVGLLQAPDTDLEKAAAWRCLFKPDRGEFLDRTGNGAVGPPDNALGREHIIHHLG